MAAGGEEEVAEVLNGHHRETHGIAKREEQIAELEEQNSVLENQLAGAVDGWRFCGDPEDDKTLPVPRIELIYEPLREWYDYQVTQRIVYRHLEGPLAAVAFNFSRVGGGINKPPIGGDDLPWRLGQQAHHDAGHLDLPLFKLMPGEKPVRLELYDNQRRRGRESRRG